MDTGLFGAVIGFGTTILLTPMARKLARRAAILSPTDPTLPEPARRSIPLLGGLPIAIAMVGIVAFVSRSDTAWVGALLSILILGTVGLYKDLVAVDVSPWAQLAFQSVAVAALVMFMQQGSATSSGITTVVVAVVCVAIVNAWNILDVKDGITAAVTCIASVSLGIAHSRLGLDGASFVAFGLAGAAAGFLLFNFPPSTIILGDLGSFTIGGLFCALVVAGPVSSTPHWLVGSLVILLVPLLELAAVAVRRMRQRRSPVRGHGPDHTVIRLSARGWTDREIVAMVVAVGLLSAVGGQLIISPIAP